MKSKTITLLIPTRERAETLKCTLMTALMQSSDGYEILVSDNASTDSTFDVVHGFVDARIRYVNPGVRLSMTDHWEFALSHVRTDYVVVIGDDDGVLPGAIDRLADCISEYPAHVYSWGVHVYIWPAEGSAARVESFYEARSVSRVEVRPLVEKALKWGMCNYAQLPHLYHAAVSMELLSFIRRDTGRFLHTTMPDVFSSYAFPVYIQSFVNVGQCITIVGHSPKSNSGSLVFKESEGEITKFMKEYEGYSLHSAVPQRFPRLPSFIVDTVLVSLEKFPSYYQDLRFNWGRGWAYQYSTMKFSSIAALVGRAPDIKSAQPDFSLLDFFFGLIVFSALKIKSRLFAMRSSRASFSNAPINISEFAKDFDVADGSYMSSRR